MPMRVGALLIVIATLAGAPSGRAEAEEQPRVAHNIVELADALGHACLSVVGHDRGGGVAYRLALDHRKLLARLVVVNVLPTVEQFGRMGGGPSLGSWPWYLLAQPAPFPERLLAAELEHFLRFVFGSWSERADAIEPHAFAEYVRAFSDEIIASMCADYRASFWFDRATTRRTAGQAGGLPARSAW
jgi:haloacetate dehalogenase